MVQHAEAPEEETLEDKFHQVIAEGFENYAKLLNQWSVVTELRQVDAAIVESRLKLEQDIAKAKENLRQSQVDLTIATVNLYDAFHPAAANPEAPSGDPSADST